MQLNWKEKVAFIESLKQNPSLFDSSKIQELIKNAKDEDMKIPILKKLIEIFIDIDSDLCASYELASDEEWEELREVKLRDKVEILETHFLDVCALFENDTEKHLELLVPIFFVKIKNLQFLIFILAKTKFKLIFGFLLAKTKKMPKTFGPFFSSLFVRLSVDREFKEKCFRAFERHLSSVTPSSETSFLVLLQCYIYILCFKEFEANLNLDEYYPYILMLNKNVVEKYSQLFNLEIKNLKTSKSESLYLFPFDLPILDFIVSEIKPYYLEFN